MAEWSKLLGWGLAAQYFGAAKNLSMFPIDLIWWVHHSKKRMKIFLRTCASGFWKSISLRRGEAGGALLFPKAWEGRGSNHKLNSVCPDYGNGKWELPKAGKIRNWQTIASRLAACFCKYRFIGTQLHPFFDIWSYGVITADLSSYNRDGIACKL